MEGDVDGMVEGRKGMVKGRQGECNCLRKNSIRRNMKSSKNTTERL